MNQTPLADDVQFWSRQMYEHALFLSLMIGDPNTKAEAEQLARIWQQRNVLGTDPSAPLAAIIALKERILERLSRGEWLGWALPSFVSHILMEARYFQARIGRGTSSAQDVQTWIQVVKDHADVGPKLVDPAAPASLPASAANLSNILGSLQKTCAAGLHIGCLHEADKDFETANQWVKSIPTGASVIPPMLAAHILRENDRGRLAVRTIGGF